jgi:c-di-GMP-related signal transduction protein
MPAPFSPRLPNIRPSNASFVDHQQCFINLPTPRLLSEYMELAPASLVADAAENLAGEPLLHMVHTKV